MSVKLKPLRIQLIQLIHLHLFKKINHECEDQNGEFMQEPLGLFPFPWPSNANSSSGTQFLKVIDYFCLLGRVMEKALQDGQLLDLPLSPAFYKLVLG